MEHEIQHMMSSETQQMMSWEIQQPLERTPSLRATSQTYTPTQPYTPKDFMKREICVGDIISWIGGGYYYSYFSYGLVLKINSEKRFIRVRNQNRNNITIWNSMNCSILAKYPDYKTIPDVYLRILDIEEF